MTFLLLISHHLLALWRGAVGLCPSCAAGEQARAAIFGDHFLLRLCTLSLPFLVLTAICYAISRRRR